MLTMCTVYYRINKRSTFRAVLKYFILFRRDNGYIPICSYFMKLCVLDLRFKINQIIFYVYPDISRYITDIFEKNVIL